MEEVALLKQLIQIPSFSGYEARLARFIVSYCQKNKIPAVIQNKNVIIHLGGKNQNCAVIFNAHMDTVTPGNKMRWKYPPFGKKAGKIVDGKIYGLGASDDKGAIVAMLTTVKSMILPPCDMWVTFVTDEESDGSGTENFLSWFVKSKYYLKYKKIAAIIGEPTDLESIEIGHRGNAFIRLQTLGITGHGAKNYNPADLAIEKMLKILSKLQKAFKKWQKKYKHPILGEPNFNITGLHTNGESVNKVPDECWATLDIRTTPKFQGKLDLLLKNTCGNRVKISYLKRPFPPTITSVESQIIKVCKKLLPEIPLTISLGSTDQSQFSKYKIETIILGPGSKEVIHKENEYIKLENIDKAVEIYRKLIFGYTAT